MNEAAEALGTPEAAPEAAPEAVAPYAVPESYAWMGEGATADHVAMAEKKGWNNPVTAMDNYTNLEKMVGGKLSVPEADDAEGWTNLYGKLGRPEEAAGYEFGELPEGHSADEIEWFRGVSHELGLSQAQASKLAGMRIERDQQLMGDMDATSETDNVNQMNELKTEWGGKYEDNINTGKSGIAALGLSQEQVAGIEKVIGTAATFKMAHQVGVKIGEPGFMDGDTNTNFGMSAGQAQGEYDSLMGRTDFRDRYLSGDASAVAQVTKLQEVIAGF